MQGRELINYIGTTSQALFNQGAISKEYIDNYNVLAKTFRKAGFAISPIRDLPVNQQNQLKQMETVINGDYKDFNKVQKYYLDNRVSVSEVYIKTITKALDRINQAPKTERANVRVDEANKVVNYFKPRVTLLQTKLEDSLTKREQKALQKPIRTAETRMRNTLQTGIRKGKTERQLYKEGDKILKKHYPDGKIVKVSTNPITKSTRTWSQATPYYMDNWQKWAEKKFQSDTTIDACIDVGNDIVKYTLSYSGDHSDICISLADGGTNADGVYSLSGRSKKYTGLPQAPPAHIGCRSTLVPQIDFENTVSGMDKSAIYSRVYGGQ